ncbi:MAG: Glyoxalase/bleomycin resistance protein/dioxygenase [Candidatus Eremiobacteraeota bacterium]|jgi:predicted enzyme related to lactoylglutathione lyase|nr:Glyoxalase/bleomycin resistance protein/dioxygenase [Candidatus Eremiobacteraeota bacterium]
MDHIRFVTVCVTDQDRALAFYEALGLEKTMDEPMGEEDRRLTVTPPGAQTGITLYRDAGRAGQCSFVYATDDVAALYDAWSQRGISFTEPPTPQMWGIQALLDDPDGNTIVVVQPQ